jgi:hypothetical protein
VAEHAIVKPEVLVKTALGMLENELIVPRTFQRESVDNYKGSENDTINVPIEGLLPFRDYAWRNDRTNPIVLDTYAERKYPISFGGNVYSAVALTDEQHDFDLDDWGRLLRPQVRAVGRGIGYRAVNHLVNAPYAVTIGNAEGDLRGALIEARRVLNRFNVPDEQRWLICGSDFESALLGADNLNFAQFVGDVDAASALKQATIGARYGFQVVVDQTLPSDTAYAMVSSAFVMITGAPSIPNSVPFGATASYEGLALRWLRDYDSQRMQDRSMVNTYVGFRYIEDPLAKRVGDNEEVSTNEYFVRAIRLKLDGTSDYPAAASELAQITGVSDASVFTPTGRKAETDPANA